jgi:hypothetical protein
MIAASGTKGQPDVILLRESRTVRRDYAVRWSAAKVAHVEVTFELGEFSRVRIVSSEQGRTRTYWHWQMESAPAWVLPLTRFEHPAARSADQVTSVDQPPSAEEWA